MASLTQCIPMVQGSLLKCFVTLEPTVGNMHRDSLLPEILSIISKRVLAHKECFTYNQTGKASHMQKALCLTIQKHYSWNPFSNGHTHVDSTPQGQIPMSLISQLVNKTLFHTQKTFRHCKQMMFPFPQFCHPWKLGFQQTELFQEILYTGAWTRQYGFHRLTIFLM